MALLNLTIEKLIYGGDGLARLPADERGRGKAVFVPFVLEGETIAATIIEEKPGFARAITEAILEPSTARIPPPCPYFLRCGGCHYQHTTYENQLAIKGAILKENLRRIAKLELQSELQVHPSPPWNYRNRTRVQARADSTFTLGYLKMSSHELLPIEQCPISSPLINRAIAVLWEMGRGGQIPATLREIELFADANDARLQIELYVDPREDKARRTQAGEALAARLRDAMPEVASVYVFSRSFQSAKGVVQHATEELDWTFDAGEFLYRTRTTSFRVRGGSFFQVNRHLIDELVTIVTSGRSGELALDLYAGVGLFATALAASFRHTIAVESSQRSASDLKYNIPPNVKVVRSTVDEYLAAKAAKLRPDLVIADPPRGGLGERVTRSLLGLRAPCLTYVSCDPATLARDLLQLTAGGYRIEQAHLVDLFPQTYHIESVVQLVR
jgi:23S rRNA (uracil1939-C5)-methyltransferase